MPTLAAENYAARSQPNLGSAVFRLFVKARLAFHWAALHDQSLWEEALAALQASPADVEHCEWAERYLCGMESRDFAAYLERRAR
jgi:hypothetical protein